MTGVLYRIGRLAARRPWVVVACWLGAAVVVVAGAGVAGRPLADSTEVSGLDSQAAADLLARAGSDRAGLGAQVVVTPADGDESFFASPGARVALAEVQRILAPLPKLVGTTDPAGALARGRGAAVASGTVSGDGRVAVIALSYPALEDLDGSDLARLEAAVAEAQAIPSVTVEARGDLYFAFGEAATGLGEVLGLVAAVVILLVAFGSVVAAGLPIGIAVLGLAIGIPAMALVNLIIDIPSWAPQMASMIGLGVGIDYALFLVTRHRELLAQGMTVEEAAGGAMATAGRAVVFAGGTVVVAISGLAVSGVGFLAAAGVATSVVVGLMVVAALTLLPAFLGLAGGRLARRGPPTAGLGRSGSGWRRWAEHVGRRAWRYGLGVPLLLVALAAPVLHLRLGFPDDGSLPPAATQRRAYDLVAAGFGAGTSGPLVIAVDLAGDTSMLDPLRNAVAGDRGIASARVQEVDLDAGVAAITAVPTSSPQDPATIDTMRRLRDSVIPGVLGDGPARAYVGGETARWADIGQRVSDRLVVFIAAVVGLSLLLLTLVFRSVVVAAKAAVLNLLSIGASYGVLVMVFQWGWGAGLIGLETTVPIVPIIPMFMFAVLFGLSMDYEVFLLSRVREEYLRTGDNYGSVVAGIASTARVITSAALIMVAVFLGFVFGDDPGTKMVGLGLATAILIDATVVRLVVAPALMRLMGAANWWIPGRTASARPRAASMAAG